MAMFNSYATNYQRVTHQVLKPILLRYHSGYGNRPPIGDLDGGCATSQGGLQSSPCWFQYWNGPWLGWFWGYSCFQETSIYVYIYIYYTINIYIYTRIYYNNNNNSNNNSNKNNNNNKINTPQMMGQLWAISWESIRNQVKTLTNPIARAEPWTHMGSPRQFLGHLATSSALPAWKQTDRCVVKIFRNWVSWLYIVYWVRHILLKHTLKKPFNHWIVVGFHG